MRFQLLCARLALAALVLAAAAAGVAVAGVRLHLFPYKAGLTLMVPASALSLIALICTLTWMAQALKRNQGEGRRVGMTALIGSLLLLWPPLHTVYNGLNAPPLNDISSDPENPPRFVALAKRAPGMNYPDFDNNRRITYRGVTGRPSYILHEFYSSWLTHPHAALQVTISQWFWRNFETTKRMGWTIIAYDEKAGRIEATTQSFWFGQVSDIVIRVERAGTTGARLDIRAQSESGDRDFGHDLALVKAYFAQLNS
jgi:hypothetical protein